MRFDDRLRTVLGSQVGDTRDRAIRWRQLVELVARSDGDSDGQLVRQALDDIRIEASAIDLQVRMSTARAIASLALPLELVCIFAADRLSVAAPILAGARLTALEWGEVIASASEECRRFIQALRTEETAEPVSEPPARAHEAQVQPSLQPQAQAHGLPLPQPLEIPSISEVVARIERLRQGREPGSEIPPAPVPRETPALFRWECDEAGEIAWVDGAPRGPLIGRSIAREENHGGDRLAARAFAERMPFHGSVLELEEGTPVAGLWRISGTPAFEPSSGRFAGYIGIAERPEVETPAETPAFPVSDPDSLRELAHEIRTPLNAIVGFAEIISGQYLGPADLSYRERADEIVEQARHLLAAIEDLDLAARIRSPEPVAQPRTDLGIVVERITLPLRKLSEEKGAELDISISRRDLTAAIGEDVAERLIMRMCTAVIERSGPGERLRLSVNQTAGKCSVSISRPAALQGLSDEQLFASSDAGSPAAFALRLTRGLARIAGADLEASDVALTLVF